MEREFQGVPSLQHELHGSLNYSQEVRMMDQIHGGEAEQLLVENKELHRKLEAQEAELERMRAREEMYRAQAGLADTIFDSVSDGVLFVGATGSILKANTAFSNLVGLDRDALIGLDEHTFFHHSTQDEKPLKREDCIILQALADGIMRVERGVVWKIGEQVFTPIEISVVPFADRAGRLSGAVATFRDMTAQEAQEQAIAELQAAERVSAIGTIASGVAHDVRGPFGNIRNIAELLLEEDLPETVKEDIELILTSALTGIDALQRFRAMYAPVAQLKAEVDLERISREAIDISQARWRQEAMRQGVAIGVVEEFAKDVPKIHGVEGELKHALLNLIFNAVDAIIATGKSGGFITIKGYQEQDQIVLEVSDTGIGMSSEVRERCFEKFFTTKGDRGTGLGLPMVRRCIYDLHKGKVEIISEQGVGTTFRITLPITPPSGEPRQEEPKDVKPSRALKVLVVDDDPIQRETLKKVLEFDHHTAVTAGDAAEALSILKSQSFDVIIADQAMPGMTGEQLADLVPSSIPVILITGFDIDQAGEGVRMLNKGEISIRALRQLLYVEKGGYK